MQHHEYLDHTVPDKYGFTPDGELIGQILTHTTRQDQYVIIGFAWMGATDEWGYEHRKLGDLGPTIVRPLPHLAGLKSDGSPRYEEYRDYPHYAIG